MLFASLTAVSSYTLTNCCRNIAVICPQCDVEESDFAAAAGNVYFQFIFFFSFLLILLQVTASDADVDRPSNIMYFLTGPGIDPENPADSNFDINKATGEIFVLKVSL